MRPKRISLLYGVVNGKRVPVCDYHGTCTNKAHKEFYPGFVNKKYSGWSYLCTKDSEQEKKRFKRKLLYCKI